jgi:hypothetical protein
MMTVLDENIYWRILADRAPTGEVILHCTIKKWTHNIYKALMATVCQIQITLKETLHAPRVSDKQERFLSMLGFHPTDKYMLGSDGNTYELFKFEVH